jgi:hypothetical protein
VVGAPPKVGGSAQSSIKAHGMVNTAVAVARRESLAGNQENFLRAPPFPGNSPAAFRDAPPSRSAVSTPFAVDEPLHQPSPGRTRRDTHRMEEMHRQCVVAPVRQVQPHQASRLQVRPHRGQLHACGPACRSAGLWVLCPCAEAAPTHPLASGRRQEPARRSACATVQFSVVGAHIWSFLPLFTWGSLRRLFINRTFFEQSAERSGPDLPYRSRDRPMASARGTAMSVLQLVNPTVLWSLIKSPSRHLTSQAAWLFRPFASTRQRGRAEALYTETVSFPLLLDLP